MMNQEQIERRLEALEERLWNVSRSINFLTGVLGAGIVGALIEMYISHKGG